MSRTWSSSGWLKQFAPVDSMMVEELSNDARVLVAVLTRVRDLAIAREQHWYRIPLRHAPSASGADALAFYQTGAFGTERWAVRYIAAIRRVHVATRLALLPDEPKHPRAHERYLCFELAPLEMLPLPVPSRTLRRVTFIPTTLGQLLRAHDLRELWRPAEDEQPSADMWAAGIAGKTIKR